MTQTVVQSNSLTHVETSMTTSSAQFTLEAGLYAFMASGTFNSHSLSLDILGPDGSTFIPVENDAGTALTLSAAGYLTAKLAAGQYQMVANGAMTSVAAAVVRIDRTNP